MSRNIVRDYIEYDRKNILGYFKLIFNGKTSKDISNVMVSSYVDLRYGYIGEDKNIINNIMNGVKKATYDYINEENFKTDNIKEEINNCLWILKYILCFEKALNDKRILKLLLKLEDKVNKRNDIQDALKILLFPIIKDNQKTKEKFIKKCSCKDFELDIKTTNIQNVFYTELVSNIKIPELFSAIAVKKVYESGTVNEDKLLVLYSLISIKILEDINNYVYYQKYVVTFDVNLLSKKNKCNQLFKIIDLDFLKDRIIMEILYDEFINNKDVVYEYIRNGFKFAVIINDDFSGNIQLLEVFEFIILNGKISKISKLKNIDNVIISELIGV